MMLLENEALSFFIAFVVKNKLSSFYKLFLNLLIYLAIVFFSPSFNLF